MADIHIDKRGKRIVVRSKGLLPGIRTGVPGAYQNVNGHWTVPLSLESCQLLRQLYGKRLVLGSELYRWAKGAQEIRAQMKELANSHDAKLRVLPHAAPKLARAMRKRKYQRVGVRCIADSDSYLVADDPGLGKTLIAMGGLIEDEIPGPYLVIAPKTAADTVWRREIRRWLPKHHRVLILPQSRAKREMLLKYSKFDTNTWLIVHPEVMLSKEWFVCAKCGKWTHRTKRIMKILACKHAKTPRTKRKITHEYPALFDRAWGSVIIDESHDSLIRRTGVRTQRRLGMDTLKLKPNGKRICLSGTPFHNRPHQLWGTLNWLDPIKYSAFHRWAETFWHKGGFGGHQIGEFRTEREKMLWDSLDGIVLRRTKAEVAKDLPPKIYVGSPLWPDNEDDSPKGIWLPMDGAQERAYEQMLMHSSAELDSGRLEAVSALAELTRLKQLACSYGDIIYREMPDGTLRHKFIPKLPSNKYQWLVDSLEEWGYPDDPITKVVVISLYTSLLGTVSDQLERHFKTKPNRPLTTAITGKVPMRHRRQIIDRFNESGNEHIMFLNVKAGGQSITLDSADRTVFLSETRIPDQQTQAEDRTHRVSNPRQCFYYYLRSLGTVDVGTALTNMELSQHSHRLLDGRRGVEYLRHVIDLSR